jgi:hypothetical protein
MDAKYFLIQCPQWKNNSVKSAALGDPADLFAEDLDEIYQDPDANIPNVGHYEARTTASEFDGAPDEPDELDHEDELEVNVEAIKVDASGSESDEDLQPKRQRSTKKVSSLLDTSLLSFAPKRLLQVGLSKRDVARLSEVRLIYIFYTFT